MLLFVTLILSLFFCVLCHASSTAALAPVVVRRRGLAVALAGTLAAIGTASAQTVDLKLNVFFTNPGNAAGGGTWELVAKSSGSGISGVQALLTNISTVVNEAPRATIGASTPGGFSELLSANLGNYTEVLIAQTPLLPGTSPQPVFYGVGTLDNGSPAFAGQPLGTNSMGPTFTTISNLVDSPWATGDAFGDAAWLTGARLLSGTFAPGAVPGFYSSGDTHSSAQVFTSVGTSANVGTVSSYLTTTVGTSVRSNFLSIGDYNADGRVDAEDYTVWRDQVGRTVQPGFGADGTGDGLVNQNDYSLWLRNFGVGTSGSLLSSAAVPEPATEILGIFSLIFVGAAVRVGRMQARG